MKGRAGVRGMARAALFAVAIALCAWLSIPSSPPFTMQTFGVFLALLVLGPRLGGAAVGAYLLMGAVGLPVFAGFGGGIGALAGPTGGYLLGLLLMGPVYGLALRLFGGSKAARAAGLLLGLAALYLAGSLWLMAQGGITFMAALAAGALPFIAPDLAKLGLAMYAAGRIARQGGGV